MEIFMYSKILQQNKKRPYLVFASCNDGYAFCLYVSLATFIKTEDKVYRMRISNSKECMKYADVDCIYEMKEDSMFDEYKDRIIAYNGALIITDYKQIFAVAS